MDSFFSSVLSNQLFIKIMSLLLTLWVRYHMKTKCAFTRYVKWALNAKLLLQNFLQNVLNDSAYPDGAIGSVAVRAAWLQWPTSLGSRPRLAGSFVSDCSGVCFEIEFSGRHRGFDGVLFKLWPLANTRFRDAQSLVPAWTIYNRWRRIACIGMSSTALFACAAKLGQGPTARGTLGLSRPSCSGY